ncbi:MAG: 4-phosphopantetheinyl transferase [Bacteroidetes bacterium CHB5]|nr:4-phosphopantetheinyl transferase [Bacteroidetes bacterium CHB5]
MPLVKLQKDNAQSGWALWFITETEETLQEIGGVRMDNSVSSYTKRLEWLAGRVLLKELVEQCGLEFYGLEKNEFGKPTLRKHPHHISLSHSYPYVAAQIDLHLEVGIDLEQPKPKLLNIAPRILSSGELADAGEDILKHCVYWCAKEALYKSYGKRGLHFADHLLVKPFELARMGDLQGSIEINGFFRQLPLQYRIQPDYVLVCTKI